jgi:hypothetical protein
VTESCTTTPQAASPNAGMTYMSVRDAAEQLHRKTWDVYCAVKQGVLQAFQPGGVGRILIRPTDLERYVGRFSMPTTGGSLAERLARAAEKRAIA